jgi:hypothetical protein
VRIAVAVLLLLAAVAPAAWAPWLACAAWPLRVSRAGIAAWLAALATVAFVFAFATITKCPPTPHV